MSPKPEPEPESGKPMARLIIRNDAGRFEYAGVVSDAGMKANIVEQLLTFYGQARLSGNLAIIRRSLCQAGSPVSTEFYPS